MVPTPAQQRCILAIVNVFETGCPDGDHRRVTVLDDGPGGRVQVSYGRCQLTEQAGLRHLLEDYLAAGGLQGSELAPYLKWVGQGRLAREGRFLEVLRRAGSDPVMVRLQDRLFLERYFQQAVDWATRQGLTLPLSLLVIYDSWVQSGGVPIWLRRRFAQRLPVDGGQERQWLWAYVRARRAWLVAHPRAILRATVYRPDCFLREMERDNWGLELRPVMANGLAVWG